MLPMEIIDLHKSQGEEGVSSPLSVALGNFDGVHVGHAALIKRAVEYAREHGLKAAVWTFSDDSSVSGKPDGKRITSTDEKLSIFRELGVDYAFLADFSAVRDYSPDRFVSELLCGECHAVLAVCGFNFRFGRGGVGDANELVRLMSPHDCIVLPPVYVGDDLVSSTAIRAYIEDGDMEGASALLGRHFSICTPVVEGKRLGRTIGIPTINQNFPEGYVIPKGGVYACRVDIGGEVYAGVANVGTRPTIKADTHAVNCETHVIGYSGILYGRCVRVSFCKRLRDEVRFEDVEALRAQITRDVEETQKYFSK